MSSAPGTGASPGSGQGKRAPAQNAGDARDDLTCMVFSEQGNAIDAFPYTADALEAQARRLRGIGSFTVEPSPFLASEASAPRSGADRKGNRAG